MPLATANSCLADNIHSSPDSSSSSLSGESDSVPEIWDEAESTSSESDTNSSEHKQLQHISDRAISHLLPFLYALFHHLSSHAKDAPLLKSFSEAFPRTNYSLRKPLKLQKFSEAFPRTNYSLRKPLKLQKLYVKYLVCPRCHRIYKELESECLVRCQIRDNPKCNHVQLPNSVKMSVQIVG